MTENNTSRNFSRFSDYLNIDKLEHETRKLFYLGLLVAVMFHVALASFFLYKKSEVKVEKPLTMELRIRKPRMTKPFEFKKQKVLKKIITKQAFRQVIIPGVQMKIKGLPDNLIGNVSSFEYSKLPSFEGSVSGEYKFVPEKIEIDLSIFKKTDNTISMKEEMIDIDDLDTGRFKGMVIKDPKNKQNIKGFVYLATLWGTQFEPAYKRAFTHLCDAMNQFTKINSKMDKHLKIDSRELLDTPFVYIAVDKGFEITEVEAKNLGLYLRNGGFAVLDNGTPEKDFGPAEMSLRWMLKKALGNDASFMPISNDHPLYHCFFDFDDGPPKGAEMDVDYTFRRSGDSQNQKPVYFLEGIWIKNRLVAIYCDKGYCKIWADDTENEPQLKMGVNMVVFALIQEGSIAQQKMELYSYTK